MNMSLFETCLLCSILWKKLKAQAEQGAMESLKVLRKI